MKKGSGPFVVPLPFYLDVTALPFSAVYRPGKAPLC